MSGSCNKWRLYRPMESLNNTDKRLLNSYLKRIEDVKSTNMGLKRATQQHVRGAKCEQVFKKIEVLQRAGKLSKNENLFATCSRLC